MGSELDELSFGIRNEAEVILYEYGLMERLNRFGKIFVSGSYFLELMTWRDLDIYLEADNMNVETFFELGRDISLCIQPSKMNFRNELIGRTEHLPQGYYWGCFAVINSNAWKVDVWSISSKDFVQKQREIHELKSKINGVQRKMILMLKNNLHNHPLYRKKFFSVDIYNAVIQDNIYSVENFRDWLLLNRQISL